jgi:hypothetical protein
MSVISVPRARLPDQVTVKFGPPDILARAFLRLDFAVRELGVYLSISRDMGELAEVNHENRCDSPALLPMFDATLGGITKDNAFWIRGVNDHGEVVLTSAARLYHWHDTTLADELESLRFFYPEPAAQARAGERCQVASDAALKISGRVSYGGAIWVRSDFRGLGLAHTVPRLARAYALTQWYPDFALGMVQTRSVTGQKAAQTYGWPHIGGTFEWTGSHVAANLGVAIGWFTRDEVAGDLASYTASLDNTARIPVIRNTGYHADTLSTLPRQ